MYSPLQRTLAIDECKFMCSKPDLNGSSVFVNAFTFFSLVYLSIETGSEHNRKNILFYYCYFYLIFTL